MNKNEISLAIELNKFNCRHCVFSVPFYYKHDDKKVNMNKIYCHRRIYGIDKDNKAIFAVMEDNEWCGEFSYD